VARNVTDEVNVYKEDTVRAVGIYPPQLYSEPVHVTLTAEWRIVPKLLAIEPLTLESGIAALRSPVNNYGLLNEKLEPMQVQALKDHSSA